MDEQRDFEKLILPYKDPNGKTQDIPALDPRWAENRQFPLYYPLIQGEEVKIDAWCSNMECLSKHCDWLLCSPYHKFWSFVVHGHQSFHEMIDSYLEQCPRYTQPESLNLSFFSHRSKISQLQQNVDKKIFLILLRMSTRREGNIFQTPEYFGRLIRDNCLFDVNRLMDLCSLYGEDNETMVKKMVDHVFKCQPDYYSDLIDLCPVIHAILDKCASNVNSILGEGRRMLQRNSREALSVYDERTIGNVIRCLVDFVYTMTNLFKFCPRAAIIFHEGGLTNRLPSLFDKIFPVLYRATSSKQMSFSMSCQQMPERLLYWKLSLVKLYRSLLCANTLDQISNAENLNDSRTADSRINDFVSCMTHLVNEKEFAAAYQESFPFEKDLDYIKQANHEVDPITASYLSDAFASLSGVNSLTKPNCYSMQSLRDSLFRKSDESVEVDFSGVDRIKDIFPDIEVNFVKEKLKNYGNNVEQLANDLLSGTLVYPSTSGAANKSESSLDVVQSEFSDNDDERELVPLASSKKRGNCNFLSDKSIVKDAKSVYTRYQYEAIEEDENEQLDADRFLAKNPNRPALLSNAKAKLADNNEESDGDDAEQALYDDEYDDTYDSHEVDVGGDSATLDEIESAFRRVKSKNDNADADTDADAAKKSANLHNRHGSDDQNSSSGGGPWRGDYTGGRERQNRERQKGRGANHNRKDRALNKHSRGFGFY